MTGTGCGVNAAMQKVSVNLARFRRSKVLEYAAFGMNLTDIAQKLNVNVSAISRNLKHLKIRLILAPYLINIKRQSFEKAFAIIKDWLDKCSVKKRLDFGAERHVKDSLNAAIRVGYLPISFDYLKTGNKELHKTLNR